MAISGSLLRELRRVAGVSIQEAAAHIGTSFTTLQKTECGYTTLTPERMGSLQRFYRGRIGDRLKGVSAALKE